MVETLERDTAVTHFAELHRGMSWRGPSELTELRRSALERFLDLGFPTTRQESWKYTNVSALGRTAFTLAGPADISIDAGKVAPYRLAHLGCELVFVNGHFSEALSCDPLTSGVRIDSLGRMLQRSPELVLGILGSGADPAHPFVALNTAFFEDGAVVRVAPGTIVERPIHLLFLTTDGTQPMMSTPRVLVSAGASTQLTLIETYVSTGGGTHFTNAVIELFTAEGSIIDHYRFQHESDSSTHVNVTHAALSRDASYDSHALTFGGGLVRNDLTTILDGEGAGCTLDGLYLLDRSEHCDHHTLIDHRKPHTNSLELYKGILDGRSRGIFDGTIIVRPNAQKITARQTNKNLLLSNEAIADSNPQLEIYADDVKCNHGSTIGQLDENALFYLRSRGIGLEEARNILTYAFASELVYRIKFGYLRERIQHLLLTRLPQKPVREVA